MQTFGIELVLFDHRLEIVIVIFHLLDLNQMVFEILDTIVLVTQLFRGGFTETLIHNGNIGVIRASLYGLNLVLESIQSIIDISQSTSQFRIEDIVT